MAGLFSSYYTIKLSEMLGKGGFGTVYLGVRKIDSLEVAVKVIPHNRLDRKIVQTLETEVQALQKLDHPNIIKFYNLFEDRNCFQICMELVRGGELFDRISKKTTYTEEEARECCRVILGAIKHCHDRNIVHRDLKPENLMMRSNDDDSDIMIVDFGLAGTVTANDPLCLSGDIGTCAYMAPEIHSRQRYGKPVDMWAFGVITYILLAGYPPFSANDTQTLIRRIRQAVFAFHEEYWRSVSEEAKQFISSLLCSDVSKRLNVNDALRHPWLKLTREQLAAHELPDSLKALHRFNAKRKLRAVLQTVLVMSKWSRVRKPPLPELGANSTIDLSTAAAGAAAPFSRAFSSAGQPIQSPGGTWHDVESMDQTHAAAVAALSDINSPSPMQQQQRVVDSHGAGVRASSADTELIKRMSTLAKMNSGIDLAHSGSASATDGSSSAGGEPNILVKRLSTLARDNSKVPTTLPPPPPSFGSSPSKGPSMSRATSTVFDGQPLVRQLTELNQSLEKEIIRNEDLLVRVQSDFDRLSVAVHEDSTELSAQRGRIQLLTTTIDNLRKTHASTAQTIEMLCQK